jgi:hypothetical protein
MEASQFYETLGTDLAAVGILCMAVGIEWEVV